MKKRLLAIMLMSAMMVTACSSASTDTTTSTDDTTSTEAAEETDATEATSDLLAQVEAGGWAGYEESVGLEGSISFMHWGDTYEAEMYAEVVAMYEELVPGVDIEIIYTPSDYYVKLQSMAASGETPDVFWTTQSLASTYSDIALCLDDYLEIYPEWTETMIEDYIDYGTVDGSVYAIPKDSASYVVFINTEMFAEAGIEIPDGDWTMEEYNEIAEALTITDESGYTSQYGVFVSNYYSEWISWLGNWEAPWFTDGQSNFSDELCITALSYMMEVIEEGYAPSPAAVENSGDSGDRLFITERVAMYPSGRWCVPSFDAECEFEYTAVALPMGTTHCVAANHGQYYIGEDSEAADIAANFISFALSEIGSAAIFTESLSMPVYTDLAEVDGFINEPSQAFIESMDYLGSAEQVEVSATGKFSEYSAIIVAELDLAFNGDQTIEEACANIDELANSTVFID
ncbi:MAG: extracellular solute-binding protein [Eubacteriales bacterium]